MSKPRDDRLVEPVIGHLRSPTTLRLPRGQISRRLQLKGRFGSYFSLPDRQTEYESLLKLLSEHGFVSLTVRETSNLIRSGLPLPARRVQLRHDVDTDPAYADRWLSTEIRFGFKASYYFRLRTLDLPAMKRIEAAGAEASYHFEELASVIRRLGRKARPVGHDIVAQARADFEENFVALQKRCEWPLKTVASHGDFINRAVGTTNSIVVADLELRARLGLWAEAYDPDIRGSFDRQFSDSMSSRWNLGDGASPEQTILDRENSLAILTHPRHWRANLLENLKEDSDRALAGVMFRLGLPGGPMVDLVNRRRILLGRSI